MIMIRLRSFYLGLFIILGSALPAAAGALSSTDCAAIKDDVHQDDARIICGDPQLAAEDRKMVEAYNAALSRLDAATGASLKADQQTYLQARERRFFFRFESNHIGGDRPPDWSIENILQHGRTGQRSAPRWLDGEMADRTAFLDALLPDQPGIEGLWANALVALDIKSTRRGDFTGSVRFTVQMSHDYLCQFAGRFQLKDQMLSFNELPDLEDEGPDRDPLAARWQRNGVTLTLQSVRTPKDSTRACSGGTLQDRPDAVLFHLAKPVPIPYLSP